jgi:hypothetical protein
MVSESPRAVKHRRVPALPSHAARRSPPIATGIGDEVATTVRDDPDAAFCRRWSRRHFLADKTPVDTIR